MSAIPRPFTLLGSGGSGGYVIPNDGKATGLQIYNTANQTTNYEKGVILWNSTQLNIGSMAGGTGVVRDVIIGGGNTAGAIPSSGKYIKISQTAPFVSYNTATSSAGSFLSLCQGTFSATSGTIAQVVIAPTYNQTSGTAANTDLLINRTETAVGSGTQRLLDLQVGAASRFYVTNAGDVSLTSQLAIGTGAAPTAKLDVASSGAQTAWGTAGVQARFRSATYTDTSTAASGTVATAAIVAFAQPTLAATNATVTTTNAATVYIAAAPTVGTNQTITNDFSLWIAAGRMRYDETATVSVATASTHKVPINIGGTLYYLLVTNV